VCAARCESAPYRQGHNKESGQMENLNRRQVAPVDIPRTMRGDVASVLTSIPAGKATPISFIGVHREDAVRAGQFRFSFEMMETAELLMNNVNVRVMAYFVPTLAHPRFQGSMDVLNRSYRKVPPLAGEAVIPYIGTVAAGAHGANEILRYLGLHARPGQVLSTTLIEAYNLIFNHRAANRSPDLTARLMTNTALAPAFWGHEKFAHIVPDFDQRLIDGEVPLNFIGLSGTTGVLPVQGFGFRSTTNDPGAQASVRESGRTAPVAYPLGSAGPATGDNLVVKVKAASTGSNNYPDVFVDTTQVLEALANEGIRVSLSNIETAKKTAVWARLRQQYEGHTDEFLIDLLMQGITVQDQVLKNPMLIGEGRTVFGQSKRYATDSGNLTESVATGLTYVDVSVNLPRVGVGGTIMFIAEITPDPIFERQQDPWLHTTDIDLYPNAMLDILDPEKVEVVENQWIDIDHDQPNDQFGYSHLNYKWDRNVVRVGGRFFRPTVDAAFDEDRQRLWAVETQNPTLSEDFYLCTQMHTKVFVVTNEDPFECAMSGGAVIEGNTQFGPRLLEASDSWQKISEQVPNDRIEKPAP